jgi:hypothetical protein
MTTQHATSGDEKSAPTAALVFPQLPQDNNNLAHKATQWIENAETELMAKGLLGVSRGGLPPAALKIIDTPVLPDDGTLTRRDQQALLSIQTENQRNAMRREELWLAAWTTLYTALLECSKVSAPLHNESLRSLCNMATVKPDWAEYGDGPRAFRMTLHLLRGRPRTRQDKAFYRHAIELQEKHKLPNGASGDEYSKRARAFYKHINPNLPQPYVGDDISEYLIEMMPADLRESGRRLTDKLHGLGLYNDYEEVIARCTALVVEEQKASAPTPSFMLTPGDLTELGLVASAASSDLVHEVCGISFSFGTPLPGTSPSGADMHPFAGLGGKPGAKWCSGCPHKLRKNGEEVECAASPYFTGPAPAGLYQRKELWASTMKLRAANCVKEGVTETPVKPPTQQAIDKYKERAKAFAERRKKREEKKAAETKEPAAFVMPSEWDDVPPIFMALSSDQMPKNIQEIDEDEEDEDEALSKAMAVPHDWFVLLPRYGHPEAEPSVACAAAGELPGFDTEVYECRQYEDEAGARLAAAIASAKQGPAQLGDPAEPGAGKAVATRSGP